MIIVSVAIASVLLGVFGYYIYGLNGDSLDFSDTEVRVVVSDSMEGEPRTQYDIETIPVGSLVFIRQVPEGYGAYDFYSSLEVGDVVTFHYRHPVTKEDMVVTHRIIKIDDASGDIRFTMSGDAIMDDPENSSKQVVYASSGDMIGKVTGVSPFLGDVMVFMSSAGGKAVVIGLLATILAITWIGPRIYNTIIGKEHDKEVD